MESLPLRQIKLLIINKLYISANICTARVHNRSMLTIYRRHRAKCKSSSQKAKCFCPIWVQGVLRGGSIRKSLDLTNWEAANKLVRDWEIHGQDVVVNVSDALDRWYMDCEARNLSSESLHKYKRFEGFSHRPLGQYTAPVRLSG